MPDDLFADMPARNNTTSSNGNKGSQRPKRRASQASLSGKRRKPTPDRYRTPSQASSSNQSNGLFDMDDDINAIFSTAAPIPISPHSASEPDLFTDNAYDTAPTYSSGRRSGNGRKPQRTRSASQSSQIQSQRKKKAKASREASKEAQLKIKPQAQSEVPKAGLLARIIFFFRTHSVPEIWDIFKYWVAHHLPVILLVGVLVLGVGLAFSRFIAIGGAVVLIGFGAILSRDDYDTASYVCYGTAFLDFLVPYLIV